MLSRCGVPNPYKIIDRHIKIHTRLQLCPGPSNSTKNVIAALNIQPITDMCKEYYAIMDATKEMAKYVFQTTNEFTVIQQTSGNGGNEAMVTNLADPGDTIIVAVQGLWGKKVADMGRRYNLNVVELEAPTGENFEFDYLEAAIVNNKAVALFVTHGESTGGTLQPLAGLGKLCHRHGCLLAVDAVATLGIVPVLVDEWQLDAVNAASQKGIGAPTGMTLLTFSERARERMKSKKNKPPYIYDLLTLGNCFNCFGKPRQYLYSYGMHTMNSVRRALLNICEEGLENVWERHREASEVFMREVTKMGFTHFVKKPENRLYGINVVNVPEGVNSLILTDYVIEKYNIEWGQGLGPSAGNGTVRVGFLADNARTEYVEKLFEAIEEGIAYAKKHPEAIKDSAIMKCLMNLESQDLV